MNATKRIAKIRLLMRKYSLFLTVLLPGLLGGYGLTTVHGSGNIVTESRHVSNFNRVVFGDAGELLLTQSGEESLTVTADDNMIAYIEIEVRDETLFIEIKEPFGAKLSPSQPVRLNLAVHEIISLDFAGLASAETGDIVTEKLEVGVSGSSSLSMASIHAHKLLFHLSGSNEVELTGEGEVRDQEIIMSGSNKYHAPQLRSQNADLTISGASNATVWATNSLRVSMSGNGNVDYYGRPQVIQNGSGRASIRSLGNP